MKVFVWQLCEQYLNNTLGAFQIKMGLASMFYQHIGKRTSTFAMAICVGAIGCERGFDRFEYFESSLVLDYFIMQLC